MEDAGGDGDVEDGEAEGGAEDSLIGVLAAGGAQLGEAGPAGERTPCAGEGHLRHVVGHADVEGGGGGGGEGGVVNERAGESAWAGPRGRDARRAARAPRGTDGH